MLGVSGRRRGEPAVEHDRDDGHQRRLRRRTSRAGRASTPRRPPSSIATSELPRTSAVHVRQHSAAVRLGRAVEQRACWRRRSRSRCATPRSAHAAANTQIAGREAGEGERQPEGERGEGRARRPGRVGNVPAREHRADDHAHGEGGRRRARTRSCSAPSVPRRRKTSTTFVTSPTRTSAHTPRISGRSSGSLPDRERLGRLRRGSVVSGRRCRVARIAVAAAASRRRWPRRSRTARRSRRVPTSSARGRRRARRRRRVLSACAERRPRGRPRRARRSTAPSPATTGFETTWPTWRATTRRVDRPEWVRRARAPTQQPPARALTRSRACGTGPSRPAARRPGRARRPGTVAQRSSAVIDHGPWPSP